MRGLTRWFAGAARALPWRAEPRDPYHALVSEFMLQQTQVSRVVEKFGAFVSRFPTVGALAGAPIDDVLAEWSGLGYYRRARNLHAAARAIVERHGGRVPGSASELGALPGVGRYTAGAIASIAFGRAEPVVDGNVARVVLRVEGLDLPRASPSTLRLVWERAGDLVARACEGGGGGPGALNEALMELGATVCTPRNPRCEACPIRSDCRAAAAGVQHVIPRPKAAPARKALHCASVLVEDGAGRVLVEPRPASGLWGGLWQAPTVERADRPATGAEVAAALGVEGAVRVGGFDYGTTHRDVRFEVWRAPAVGGARKGAVRRRRPGSEWLTRERIGRLALSNAQRRILLGEGPAADQVAAAVI